MEDESVKEERGRVNGGSVENDPLVIRNIEKKYEISNGQKDYVAVKPMSFTIKEN